MVRWLSLAALFLLAACALPVPLRVATWAFDGISFIASGKSVSDHGISLLTRQDCGVLRGIATERLCMDREGAVTVAGLNALGRLPVVAGRPLGPGEEAEAAELAALSLRLLGDWPTDVAAETGIRITRDAALSAATERTNDPDAADLAAFATAAGSANPEEAGGEAVEPPVLADVAWRAPVMAPPARSRPLADPAEARRRAPDRGAFYWVIASFRLRDNAQAFRVRHGPIGASILETSIDGRVHYRVVVGPHAAAEGPAVRARLRDAGIVDAWALAADPATRVPDDQAAEIAHRRH